MSCFCDINLHVDIIKVLKKSEYFSEKGGIRLWRK